MNRISLSQLQDVRRIGSVIGVIGDFYLEGDESASVCRWIGVVIGVIGDFHLVGD